MKVKIKLTIEQFKFLLKYIDAAIYDKIMFFTEMELLNLRAFLGTGYKKLIDLQSALILTPNKVKTFSIDVNQLYIVLTVLTRQVEFLEPFMRATFEDMRRQNKAFFTVGLNY